MPDGIIMTSTKSPVIIKKKEEAGFKKQDLGFFEEYCGDDDVNMVRREIYFDWTHMALDLRDGSEFSET